MTSHDKLKRTVADLPTPEIRKIWRQTGKGSGD